MVCQWLRHPNRQLKAEGDVMSAIEMALFTVVVLPLGLLAHVFIIRLGVRKGYRWWHVLLAGNVSCGLGYIAFFVLPSKRTEVVPSAEVLAIEWRVIAKSIPLLVLIGLTVVFAVWSEQAGSSRPSPGEIALRVVVRVIFLVAIVPLAKRTAEAARGYDEAWDATVASEGSCDVE
jgi:hypothetical protein